MDKNGSNQSPSRSANFFRTRSNSCVLSSPSFRSNRGTGAECTCCTWYAPSLRKGFAICNSHRLPRSASIIQTSPGRGLGLGILPFSVINLLTGSQQKIVCQLHFLLFSSQFEDPPG